MSETGIGKLHQRLYGRIGRKEKPADHAYWWDKILELIRGDSADEKLRSKRQSSPPLTFLYYMAGLDPPAYSSLKYPSSMGEAALPYKEKMYSDIRTEENRRASLARMRRDIEDILLDALSKAREDRKLKEQQIRLPGEI